jgi:hypothetical protein
MFLLKQVKEDAFLTTINKSLEGPDLSATGKAPYEHWTFP